MHCTWNAMSLCVCGNWHSVFSCAICALFACNFLIKIEWNKKKIAACVTVRVSRLLCRDFRRRPIPFRSQECLRMLFFLHTVWVFVWHAQAFHCGRIGLWRIWHICQNGIHHSTPPFARWMCGGVRGQNKKLYYWKLEYCRLLYERFCDISAL